MATFVTTKNFQMPKIRAYGEGNLDLEFKLDNKAVEIMGLDLKRMINEFAEGVVRVKRPMRRTITPWQINIGIEYNYPGRETGVSTNHEIRAEASVWGDFQLNRTGNRMNNSSDIIGKFDEIDWFRYPLDPVKWPRGGPKGGGFQAFGLKPISVEKFLKASPNKRFKLFTGGNDVIMGNWRNDDKKVQNILDGGNGDDWIFCTNLDEVTGGKGKDVFYLEGFSYETAKPDINTTHRHSPTLIKDFNPSHDSIEIAEARRSEKLYLVDSPKGSYLVAEYSDTNYWTLAEFKGLDKREQLNIDWVPAPAFPYSGEPT